MQNTLLERLRDLETENCNLTRDAELQRRQYERCLDDVANQVVRALLTQKVGTLYVTYLYDGELAVRCDMFCMTPCAVATRKVFSVTIVKNIRTAVWIILFDKRTLMK